MTIPNTRSLDPGSYITFLGSNELMDSMGGSDIFAVSGFFFTDFVGGDFHPQNSEGLFTQVGT